MRRRFGYFLVLLASFAGCGASCKKAPDNSINSDPNAIIELAEVDTSALIPDEKRTYSKVIRDTMSPCGEPVTIEVCIREKRSCSKCLQAAKMVVKMVVKGDGDEEMRKWIEKRFDNKSVVSIDLTNSPSLGPANAPIIMVEFADFECPFCGFAAPQLHEIIEDKEFKDKIRFVFKNFPLPMHENGESAARAAIVAQKFGKFWDMHSLLFTNQKELKAENLESYAGKVGITVEQFREEMASAATKAKLAKDKEIGNNVGVQGTPTIFINGRKFDTYGKGQLKEQLKEWIRMELSMLGNSSSNPKPSTSNSSSPSAAVTSSNSSR